MFTDEDLDPIEFKSAWKKERSLCDGETQTRDLQTADVAVQAIKRKHKEVQTSPTLRRRRIIKTKIVDGKEIQTEDFIEEDIQLYDDDSAELVVFCKLVESIMSKELLKSERSHAFDGYDLAWGEENNAVTCLHKLTHKEFNNLLQITGLSWNSTGSVIAACYGRFDHEDWCTHKSALCTWNLDRRKLDANKPDTVIDVSSCLTCIACHPKKPSLIVGGTFNGELIVWDTSCEEDMLIASSGIGDDSHREPVSKVQWLLDPNSKGKKYHVVSISSDGRILVWKMSERKHVLKLHEGYILMTESLPRHIWVKAKRGDKEMGVTCLSFNPLDDTSFLIGSDSGGIFRCSTMTKGTPANSEVISSVPLHSPVTFCYGTHNGPVYGVECSPFHRNLFLSCGTDNTARIYSMLEAPPLLQFEPSCGYLYSIKWSPIRPLVFATTTEHGHLLFYDLKKNRATPVLKLEITEKQRPVYSVQFNPHQSQLLATGDGEGNIQVWRLNDELTQSATMETDILDEIAGSAFE